MMNWLRFEKLRILVSMLPLTVRVPNANSIVIWCKPWARLVTHGKLFPGD